MMHLDNMTLGILMNTGSPQAHMLHSLSVAGARDSPDSQARRLGRVAVVTWASEGGQGLFWPHLRGSIESVSPASNGTYHAAFLQHESARSTMQA